MTAPSVIITAMYVAALILVFTQPMSTTALVATMLLVGLAMHLVCTAQLFRHQKLLEWFSNHIRLEAKKMPPDAPDDLWDDGDDKSL